MELKELILVKLKAAFPVVQFNELEYRGELTLSFPKEYIVRVCRLLKDDAELAFVLCNDVTAIDWARKKNRFTMVYHIYSLQHNFRLRLKCDLEESDAHVDSVSSVWLTANWEEREVYDMYGITFNNHPDLRRMYMPEEFEYFPLRKEFPLMGIPGSLSLPKK